MRQALIILISIFVFFYPYPLGSGLDKFYIGVGNDYDFMNYFGKGNLPPTTQDILIHVTPQLGWKFNASSSVKENII